MSSARLAAVVAVAALAASLAAAGPAWAGAAAHAAPGGEVIGVRWAIVDAVVSAGADGRGGLIVVTGTTDRPGEPILVTPRAPDGSILARLAAEADPLDGSFLAEVPAAGPGWAADGLYTVTLYQGAGADATGGRDGAPPPYVDIVPIAMAGGAILPNAELAGADVPPAAAGYASPSVVNLKWSLIREVSVVPDGGAAGGDAVRLSGAAPAGYASPVPVRVVAPTGLEMASPGPAAVGPSGGFEVVLETDGSGWAQDGTYRIVVGGGGAAERAPGAAAAAAAPPDLLLVDIFDGSLAPSASAAAAAADPRGEGAGGPAAGDRMLLAKRWNLVDAVAVSGHAGQAPRILIAGSTDRPDLPVSVRVDGPRGGAAHASTILPDGPGGGFLVDVWTGGAEWAADGPYLARVEQRDARTGIVHHSDLIRLDVEGGEAAAQPRLSGADLPPAIASAYADARLAALEYAVVEEVWAVASAPGAGMPARYAEIVVSGRTSDRSAPISVGVEAPDGSAARPMPVEPRADGRFEARVATAAPFWSADGAYAVTVTQGGAGPPFIDIALVDVRGGAVAEASARPPPPDGEARKASPGSQPRIMNIGERWKIIDLIALAEGGAAGAAGQVIVVDGTTDIADRAVQAAVEAPGGAGTVAALEAMPDASGSVSIEVPAGAAAWGPGAPADGTYTLSVGQPGTRYLDEYPVYVSGGRVVAPAEFAGAPLPPQYADRYESARLLDMAWTLVERADVRISPDGSPAAVVVRGEAGHPKVPVAVRAVSPAGAAIYDARIATQPDGSFAAWIDASGAEWAADGTYRITLSQGFGSVPPDLVLVEVVDGAVVPEFGIASAALAAAVAASIAVAVAASSRLGLAGGPRLAPAA